MRFLGRVTIEGADVGRDIELELFEAGGLFAVESGFLQRGERTITDPFDETGNTTCILPDGRLAETVAKVIDVSRRSEGRRMP